MHFTCTHVYDDSFRVFVCEVRFVHWYINILCRKSATKEKMVKSADSWKCAVTFEANFTGIKTQKKYNGRSFFGKSFQKYSQNALLENLKITIMVCSRNMASLKKF